MEIHLPAERDVDAWQVAVWNLPDEVASRAQRLQFMLMLEAGFNSFDPFKIVGDLLRHREWWIGAVMDRAYFVPDPEDKSGWGRMVTDLIKLRDIHRCWNIDHLFILTDTTHDTDWLELVKEWDADVNFIEGDDVSAVLGSSRARGRHKILSAWWD